MAVLTSSYLFSSVLLAYTHQNVPSLDISEFSHEHEVEIPGDYFSGIMVYYTPLPVLEYLGDPNIVWSSDEHHRRMAEQRKPPLQLYSGFEVTQADVQHIAMFDNEGDIWTAIVTQNNHISFIHRNVADSVLLRCRDHPAFHAQVSHTLSYRF